MSQIHDLHPQTETSSWTQHCIHGQNNNHGMKSQYETLKSLSSLIQFQSHIFYVMKKKAFLHNMTAFIQNITEKFFTVKVGRHCLPRAAVGAPSWKFAMTKEAVDALAERKKFPFSYSNQECYNMSS